ncbi:MAG: nuclear transport factor 2 family protein, partial [Gemmatimonadaceae bacterium]
MRPLILIAVGLAFAAITACTDPESSRNSSGDQQMEAEEQIRKLQNEWMQAWVREDRATLERILAPDYKLIVSSMPDRPVSREQWLALIGRYTAEGVAYDKMVVRLFGDTAVVSSLLNVTGAKVDGLDRSGTFFITDVWQRRD